ncbi:MAG: MoxR family ATPase [Crocinitomicaceae bacterium]|nr:MoxR family ATPase [Crocinitomicaceae bacterium]
MNEDVNNNEQENDYSSFMPKENQEPEGTPSVNEDPVEPVSESSSTGYGFERENAEIVWVAQKVNELRREFSNYVIGQHEMVELLLTGIFSNGHILLEGVPGIAKTLSAKVIAKALDIQFSRIQFTPDMMPSDVIGTSVYNMKDSSFIFNKGPVFANVVLIDEINRAPAKTQSALFEVMEERQITYDGQLYPMDFPFLVVATQNPVDQEGTYNLPEAQLDRFLFKIKITYPDLSQEEEILFRYKNQIKSTDLSAINKVFSVTDIHKVQSIVEQIIVEEHLLKYIAALVHKTRNHGNVYLGASPRASLSLLKSSKALAAIRGRDFVTPEDIQFLAPHVLNHRLILTPEAEMDGTTTEEVIAEIIEQVEVPR